MAVTKRMRFEILRRDNHSCRYCGASAPDVKLVVDHVTPVALGGTDSPDNLVASCAPCNSGKSSTAPDAPLVADVRADALRHATLVRDAYAVLVEHMGERDDYIDSWREEWTRGELPADWRNTIGRWFEMGVPLEIPEDAARIACSRTSVRDSGRFSYMCGIVWSQVQMVDELAETHRHIAGTFKSDEALSEARLDAFDYGYEQGATFEFRLSARLDPVSAVVDRINYPDLEGMAFTDG